jgi:4-carboxymuconolactone decarboxylase
VPIRTVLINGLYCGVSSANTAFKTAQQVFHEMDNTGMDTTP